MNWTKTPPSKPGAYWWRNGYAPVTVRLIELYISKDREAIACGYATHGDAKSLGGEWCGPLVPVEEVRRAYYEGHIHAISSDPDMDPQEHSWPNSHARKVVEGEL